LPLTQGIKHLFGAHQIRTLPGLAIKLKVEPDLEARRSNAASTGNFWRIPLRTVHSVATGSALQLIAQIRRRALNGQCIRRRIPKNTLAQQQGIEVNG
jgi:hypothetical protein